MLTLDEAGELLARKTEPVKHYNESILRRERRSLNELCDRYRKKRKDAEAHIMQVVEMDIYEEIADLIGLKYAIHEKEQFIALLEKGEIS